MADGSIRITLDARQAKAMAQQLENQLKSLDSQAQQTQSTTDKLSGKTKQSADSYRKLVTSVNQLTISVRQLGQHTNNHMSSLTQLNSSIRQMIQSNNTLTSTINNLASSLNNLRSAEAGAANQAQNTSSAMHGMGASMERTTGIANSLKAVLATFGTVLSFQYAAKTLMEFDHAMAQVEAISRAAGAQLDALREKAKLLGATTIYTSGEAATGMKYLAQSGFDVNEILTAASSVLALAQAGDIGLAQASEIAAKALRGFRLDASQMSDVADVMAAAVTQSTMNIQEMGYAFKYVAPIAASMGVSMREASAYIGVLSDAGIDATMAGTALRRIMSEISNPTIKATKLLEAHGLTMADVNIKTLGLTKVMDNLIKANLSVGETFALFGDRGAPAFQTLAQQIDVVKKKHENLMDVSGRAAKMQEVMNQSLYAAFKNLTSAIEFLIIQFSEGTGILGGLKAAMFGVAEGIRFFAKHLQLVVPVVALLLYTHLPKLITMIFGIKTATASVGATTVATAATTRASWATIGTSIATTGKAIAGCVTSMAALRTAAAGVFAALGGWIGIAVVGISALWMHMSQYKSAVEQAADSHSDLIRMFKEGKTNSDEYAEALRKQQVELEKLGKDRGLVELANKTKQFGAMIDELGQKYYVFREQATIEGVSKEYKDFMNNLADVILEMQKLQREGQLDSEAMQGLQDRVKQLTTELPQTEDKARAMGVALQDNMQVAYLVARAMDILAGKFKGAGAAARAAASDFRDAAAAQREFLSGKQISGMISKTERANYDTQFYEDLAKAGVKKNAGRNAISQHQEIASTLTPEQLRFTERHIDANGKLSYSLVSLDKYIAQNTATWKENGIVGAKAVTATIQLMNDYNASAANVKKGVVEMNKMTSAMHASQEAQDRLNESWKEGKKSGGGAAKAAKAQATALGKVNEELARMTMTDREVQQLKFEQELAKLEKVLGKTNPQFQQLVQLWEKAKALGLSSPKEIMNARTKFEDWQKAQEHGGDEKWAEKAKVDAQAQYLQQIYQNDANMAVQIAQWAADEKRKITSGSIAKDTQSLLKFWEDYINIAAGGEQQYSALLDQYYQERYNAYLALCNNEVAARAKAEDDKLRKSREALDGIKVATRDWITENTNMAKQMGDLATTVYDGIADAMYNMVTTGKANWEELGKAILAELTKMIIKTMILASVMKMIGLAFNMGSNTAGAEEGLMMQPDFWAKGAVATGISSHSNQIVSSPTAFTYGKEIKKFARGTAVMGEAGSEAVMPLARDRKGRLGVRSQDGGNTGGQAPVVNVSMVNTTGQKATTQTKTDNQGNKSLEVMIGDAAAGQMLKTGTALNKAARTFSGVSQQVTRR